ncbi:MAG: hypothetical protein ACXVEE_33085 [Polyangiales bacterium]
MASVMAIVSKAQFEKDLGKSAREGAIYGTEIYRSQHATLRSLGEGGSLFLVTVRPPDEKLWLVAVLESPRSSDEGWNAKTNRVAITDISALKERLRFASGTGITAKAGALGMSLQTPRALSDADVTLLRGAIGGESVEPVAAPPPPPKAPPPPKPPVATPGAAFVDDAWLVALRTVSEAKRAIVTPRRTESSRAFSKNGELAASWKEASVVATKPKEAGDEMYGESIDPAKPPSSLTPASKELFARDVANLDPVMLIQSFPRDRNGFVLGETVLLAGYEAVSPAKPKKKQPWLVARGPLKRSHPQVVAILLDVIDAENFPVQWSTWRHLWDRTHASASEEARFGVADLPLPLLDAEERDARIAKLSKRHDTEGERAALSILLLDAGRFEEALAVYDIGLSRELAQVMSARPQQAFYELIVEGHGTSLGEDYLQTQADVSAGKWGERWKAELRQQLHRSAPWMLARAPLPKKSKSDPARARLFNLPYGSAARRPAVFLTETEKGRALHLDFSGIATYLPEPAWTRPIELDLLRFGLA